MKMKPYDTGFVDGEHALIVGSSFLGLVEGFEEHAFEDPDPRRRRERPGKACDARLSIANDTDRGKGRLVDENIESK